MTFWGVPGDPRHNPSRGWSCLAYGAPGTLRRKPCELHPRPDAAAPFLPLPTSCEESLNTTVEGEAWTGEQLGAAAGRSSWPANPTQLEGCEELPFDPSNQVQPDSEDASTPTGLTVKVNVPQQTTLESSSKAPVGRGRHQGHDIGTAGRPAGKSRRGQRPRDVLGSEVGFDGQDSDAGET